MTAVSDRRNEVASRVAEAFHSTADPTRPPEVCVPQRVRQTLLPRRLSLRPAAPAARPAPGRLPPGHGPAVAARPAGRHHRRPVGLRPFDGAPLDPPLRRLRRLRACRPAPSGPAPAQPAHAAPPRPQVAAWRRPRLVAKGDPDREQVLAGLRQQPSDLPEDAVVLAEDETHVNLLPWVARQLDRPRAAAAGHDPRNQPARRDLRRR